LTSLRQLWPVGWRLDIRRRVALLRIAFGLVWIIDASFKIAGTFVENFQSQVDGAAAGQPGWLHWWFEMWSDITAWGPHAFAYLTILIELLTGLGLVLGFARRPGYLLALLWSLAIWAIPEGFGGPYSSASTDIGTGIIYAIVFAALYGLETVSAAPAWAVDSAIERRIGWWKRLVEPARSSPGTGQLFYSE
jgi:nitrite reductase (NO-forming)